jgi:hypothetical protein
MGTFLQNLAVTLVGGSSSDTINIPQLSANQVLQNGLNIAYFLAGTIAVIVIIIGGITYATAAGNSSNVTKAKNLILYSVIGLVVIIIAFAITNFVIGRFSS